MSDAPAMDKLFARVKELRETGGYDLSLEEDLSIAVMNLISLEEHFFFTAKKTDKSDYLDLLAQTREIRKRMLGKMIPQTEGETWCISKHLLAASMRLLEVGTKYQTDKKMKEAKEAFDDSYRLYSLFWAIRLKILKTDGVKKLDPKKPLAVEDLVNELVNCCKE